MINAKDYTIPLTADDLAAAEKFMQMKNNRTPLTNADDDKVIELMKKARNAIKKRR